MNRLALYYTDGVILSTDVLTPPVDPKQDPPASDEDRMRQGVRNALRDLLPRCVKLYPERTVEKIVLKHYQPKHQRQAFRDEVLDIDVAAFNALVQDQIARSTAEEMTTQFLAGKSQEAKERDA